MPRIRTRSSSRSSTRSSPAPTATGRPGRRTPPRSCRPKASGGRRRGGRRVKAVHRRTGDVDLYALVNRSRRGHHHDGRPAGPGRERAVRAGPWTGKVAAVGVFTASRGRTTLDVTIEAGSTELVALAGRRFTGSTVPPRRALDGREDPPGGRTARHLRADDAAPSRRGSATAGPYGPRFPACPLLASWAGWDLRLDEWLPGGPADASTVTRHETHEIRTCRSGPGRHRTASRTPWVWAPTRPR